MDQSVKHTITEWQKFTIKDWRTAVKKAKIGVSNQFYDSFTGAPSEQSNGDIEKITFTFLYYGKFPDMGVGRGVGIGGVRELSTMRSITKNRSGRKRKKWLNKSYYSNINALTNLIARDYGSIAASQLVSAIESKIIING